MFNDGEKRLSYRGLETCSVRILQYYTIPMLMSLVVKTLKLLGGFFRHNYKSLIVAQINNVFIAY